MLTYVYTYMLKSIKHNNDINFQKLPDNFNLKSDGIQTVKPNLQIRQLNLVLAYLKGLFSQELVNKIKRYNLTLKDVEEIFNTDILMILKSKVSFEELKYVFENDIIPKLTKIFNDQDIKEIKNDFNKYWEEHPEFKTTFFVETYLDLFLKYMNKFIFEDSF